MRARPMRDRCLPEKYVRALAIEVAGGDVRETSWQQALSIDTLTRLFGAEAGIVQGHLGSCPDCMERINRELRSIDACREELSSFHAQRSARAILAAADIAFGVVLKFASYDSESASLPMAARTSPALSHPLRFCSSDENVVLKEIDSGAFMDRKRLFVLMGVIDQFGPKPVIFFAGREYCPDQRGVVDFADAAELIDDQSEFIVRPCTG